jgi:hypothetical protein
MGLAAKKRAWQACVHAQIVAANYEGINCIPVIEGTNKDGEVVH